MVTITTKQIEEQPYMFVEQLKGGEDILITSDSVPLARVQGLKPHSRVTLFGSSSGKMWLADDFDAPLQEFEGD